MTVVSRIVFVVVSVVFAAAAAVAAAQETSSLRGTVSDVSGGVIVGATVIATDPQAGARHETVSDAAGRYQLPRLAPGDYLITVEASGFKMLVRGPVSLLVATPATLDVTLEVGAVSETVTVAGDAGRVNTVDATIGHSIGDEEITRLPFLARNPINLLTLQPGVVFTGESDTDLLSEGSTSRLDRREGAVNGVRGNQTNVSVDGINASDWQAQAAFSVALPVTLDSVQEFRVVTGLATATDGGASGAQVSLVTRSGSNDWRGNTRWYYRGSETAANSFFNNRIGLAKPDLSRHIAGGSLGGPIRRNRAFVFLDYESRRDRSAETVLRLVPTETFRSGVLRYRSTAGIQSLSGAAFQALDPLGQGINPAVVQYLSLFPLGNDPAVGDGLNTIGLRFNAPLDGDSDIYTTRFDYQLTADGRQSLFARATLGDIARDLLPSQLPGGAANASLVNRSGGFASGHTAQLGSTMINRAQVGLTVADVVQTGGTATSWAITPTIDSVANTSRAFGRRVPQWEVKDDLTWSRGAHTVQTGGVLRLIRHDVFNEQRSFASNLTAGSTGCCRAPYDALLADGNPGNDPSVAADFISAYTALTGAITSTFTYSFVDPATGRLLPLGTPLENRFREDHYEAYLSDTWRITRDLTATLGLRYSYFTPLWETEGRQLRPTVDVQTLWETHLANMQAGWPADASPRVGFELAGKANDAKPWWDPDRNNLAPRVALAWTPRVGGGIGRWLIGEPGQSVLRGGFGTYYDRVGGPMAVVSNIDGNQGLSTRLGALPGVTLASAARFSGTCAVTDGCTGFPPLEQISVVPGAITFPNVRPDGSLDPAFMVDNRLKTPSYRQWNLSWQRELPGRTLLDVGYVGSQGRDLLLKADINQYQGLLRDPTSGQTMWDTMRQVASLIGPDPLRPALSPSDPAALARIPVLPFVESLMPNLPAFLAARGAQYASMTPSQAFYAYIASRAPDYGPAIGTGFDIAPGALSPWSTAIDPERNGFVLFYPQMTFGLSTWTNWGSSDYHSLQLSLRKNVGASLFGVNYALSKSTDTGSAFENGGLIDLGNGGGDGLILNALDVPAHRAVSDFDLRHNLNAHWVVDLPLGPGRAIAGRTGSLAGGLIGGWGIVGSTRWRSGFPLSPIGINRGLGLFTRPYAAVTGIVDTDITPTSPGGVPNLFADPRAAAAQISYTEPGGIGSRNALRGPGYFVMDLGVRKDTRLPWHRSHRLVVRVDAFNVLNTVNYSTTGLDLNALSATFGQIRNTAGARGGARELEFGVRYEF